MVGLPCFVVVFAGLFCHSQAAAPKFEAQVSDSFLFPGQSVKVTQITTLTDAGPLRFKFNVPFNNSAYMRILNFRLEIEDEARIQYTGSKSPNLTLSAGKPNIIDTVQLNFGQVAPTGTVTITITFYVQLLDHPQLTNGEEKWISLGAELTNGSIWVNQQLIRCFKTIEPKTVLRGSSKVLEKDDVLIGGSPVNVRFTLVHNALKTTAAASSLNITLLHPECLVYKSLALVGESVTVHLKDQSSTAKLLAVDGPFKFEHALNVTFTFNVDPSKTKPKGIINEAFVAFKVAYHYSSPFSQTPKRGNMKKAPRNKVRFYHSRDSCDTDLGMISGAITDNMIRVSSHAAADAANIGRLKQGAKAWIPYIKRGRNQFVEVNFQGIKEIQRIQIEGNGTGTTGLYVTKFRIFYSLDCVQWKIYRLHHKEEFLMGNTGADKLAVIPLVPPIKAKCIRINPKSSYNGIALKFALFGCASSMNVPTATLKSRTLLAEANTGHIYACHIPMISRGGPSCFFSKDKGTSWKDIDRNVVNVNFINPATKTIYGMGLTNTHYKCAAEPSDCRLITQAVYTQEKAASGVQHAKLITPITTTEEASSKLPVSGDTFTLANSKKVGGSASGVYYYDSSWTQKLAWDFLGS